VPSTQTLFSAAAYAGAAKTPVSTAATTATIVIRLMMMLVASPRRPRR
jgi:hypothetical protein